MPTSIPPYREKKVKKRNPNRWAIGFIVLFFVSALILLFFQSPLSKVQNIEIDGHITLDENDILAQVSLVPGVQFFEWDRKTAKHELMKNPQVKEASVTKVFPGKVVIMIKEWQRVALWLQSEDNVAGQLLPVLENGTIVREPWTGKVDKPLLRGWESKSNVKALSQELAKVTPDTLRTLSEIHPQESDTYEDEVRVFTEEGNEVITRISTFHDNINQYRDFIPPGKKGTVHMTTSKDFGWFTPYEQEEKAENKEEVKETQKN